MIYIFLLLAFISNTYSSSESSYDPDYESQESEHEYESETEQHQAFVPANPLEASGLIMTMPQVRLLNRAYWEASKPFFTLQMPLTRQKSYLRPFVMDQVICINSYPGFPHLQP